MIQLWYCSTICCRGQIIAGQTSSLHLASSCEDNAGRHDVMCMLHWQRNCGAVWKAGGIRGLSTQPSLSIYTELVANTLSFHLFPLRIKHPRCATRFVSHWGHCWKPAPRPIHNLHRHKWTYVFILLFTCHCRCYVWTHWLGFRYSDV